MWRITHFGNFFRPNKLDWIWKLDEDEAKRDLLAEVKASGCDNVIMSTEALASAPWRATVKDYFSDFDAHIVFFLRRQDRWLESAYQEEQKNGIDDADNDFYLESRTHWLDYYQRLSGWAAVFGADHMRAAIFEKRAGKQSVEEQFLRVIDAPMPNKIATASS